MNDYYNDKDFSYDRYWKDRQYEHASEVMAIDNMLKNRKFATAADVGGGFGRLTLILAPEVEQMTLIEPSEKMRTMAKTYLKSEPNVKILAGSINRTSLPDASQNLVISVRVMHHITDLAPAIAELSRITKADGLLLLEFANSINLKARIRSIISGKPILRTPIDLRSSANIKRKSIPFVNHHPETILKFLQQNDFTVQRTLSVSNLRSPFLKKVLPLSILKALEYFMQFTLSGLYFGPSIFVLAKKVDI